MKHPEPDRFELKTRTEKAKILPWPLITKKQLPITQEEYEHLLDYLRPVHNFIESKFLNEECGGEKTVGAMIYADGNLEMVADPIPDTEENREKLATWISDNINFLKFPPRLWGGLRGAISRFYGIRCDKEFNRWIDYFNDYNALEMSFDEYKDYIQNQKPKKGGAA